VQGKHIFFLCYGLIMLFVFYRFDLPLLNSHSPERQHLMPVQGWMLLHGIGGPMGLLLGPLQFSTRLRQRNPRLHRILGRFYIGGVLLATPAAVAIAIILGPPVLVMAATLQSTGWLVSTAIAFYFIRNRKIQQHREWMMRGYPFAMVFVAARALLSIPAIARLGEVGLVSVVWSCIVAAAFLPTLVIQWRTPVPRR
jgi:uncharacterized membrane protein